MVTGHKEKMYNLDILRMMPKYVKIIPTVIQTDDDAYISHNDVLHLYIHICMYILSK